MHLQFIQNLRNIQEKQLNQALEAANFLAIGASAYYILFGGILSISNIIGSILKQPFTESSRIKIALISGFIFFSALIKTLYHEHYTNFKPFDSINFTESTSSLRLIIAGFLVGFGSQYGVRNSKQSFGIDGMPSFNLKSILAHFFALLAAILTHTYRLQQFLPKTPRIMEIDLPNNITYTAFLLVFVLIPFICFVISSKKSFKTLISYLFLFIIGVVFGYGLMLGQFTQRKTFYQFLDLDQNWDPKIIIIFGYALLISLFVNLFRKYLIKKPVFGTQFIKDDTPIQLNLFIGSILFGIGWGLGGLKPSIILLLMPLQSIKIVFYWGLPCLLGMKAAQKLFQQKTEQSLNPHKKQ